EDEDEVSATDERPAGLRLGAGGGLDPGSADSLSPQDPVALGSSARAGLPGQAAAAALGAPGRPRPACQLIGRELPRLRDYLSNPGNFEGQSGTPPGTGAPGVPGAAGLGGAGGREPSTTSGGGQLSNPCPILEFELRKAKETIQALRADLTKAAEHGVPLQERKNHKSSPEIQPVKPLEKRALNFLVSEFLLKNNYKLTSIMIKHSKTSKLTTALLRFWKSSSNWKDLVEVASGVEEDELEALTPVLGSLPSTLETPQTVENSLLVQKLEDKISLFNIEKWSLMEQIRRLESEMDFLKNEHFGSPVVCDSVQPSLDQSPHKDSEDSGKKSVINSFDKGENKDVHLSKSDEVDSTVPKENFPHSFLRIEREAIPSSSPSSKNRVHFDKPNRLVLFSSWKLSPAFHQALLSFCRMSADSHLGSEVSWTADSETSIMLMLGRCLLHIVPNVLLAKREELIPLILCTACLHPEPKERDQLLHILFSLIKRPDDEQRQMILTGCVAFARRVGPTRVEAELLPQCWEQINHKYPERRLLVAESCGALAPYLPKEIRSSLVLSMLQQMLMEDKADLRFELLLSALCDPSERVVSATHQVFLPATAAWTTELGNLQSHLIPKLLNKIEKLLREGEHRLDEHKLHMFLSALQSLIPSLFTLVLPNTPFSSKAKLHGDVPQIEVARFPRPMSPLQDVSTIIGSHEQLALLLQLYDYHLPWVVSQLLPQLIEIVGKINVTSTACVHEFSRFFWRLCRTFGKIFTNTKVKTYKCCIFQSLLHLPNQTFWIFSSGCLGKTSVPGDFKAHKFIISYLELLKIKTTSHFGHWSFSHLSKLCMLMALKVFKNTVKSLYTSTVRGRLILTTDPVQVVLHDNVLSNWTFNLVIMEILIFFLSSFKHPIKFHYFIFTLIISYYVTFSSVSLSVLTHCILHLFRSPLLELDMEKQTGSKQETDVPLATSLLLHCSFVIIYQIILTSVIKECEQKLENKTAQEPQG
ncbi:hypothetical protein FD755_005475, partial [Muntiacus reevesi]